MLALDCLRRFPESNEQATKPCKQVKDGFAMETDAVEGRDFTLGRQSQQVTATDLAGF